MENCLVTPNIRRTFMEINKDMNTQIKQFLKTTFPKQFIYYNNKSSIKIQLPTSISQSLITYLHSLDIKFTHTTPEYIIHKFNFYPNFTQIHIKK